MFLGFESDKISSDTVLSGDYGGPDSYYYV